MIAGTKKVRAKSEMQKRRLTWKRPMNMWGIGMVVMFTTTFFSPWEFCILVNCPLEIKEVEVEIIVKTDNDTKCAKKFELSTFSVNIVKKKKKVLQYIYMTVHFLLSFHSMRTVYNQIKSCDVVVPTDALLFAFQELPRQISASCHPPRHSLLPHHSAISKWEMKKPNIFKADLTQF